MAYATQADLSAYLGGASLPADVDRLLDRASDDIDYFVQPNAVDITDAAQMALVTNAACAQVEYWINSGESESTYEGTIVTKTVGKTSVTYADPTRGGSGGRPQLANRAQRYLSRAGLLYRGAKIR